MSNIKIGITERGDAGRDLRWTHTIHAVEGAILITKSITLEFIDAVLACQKPIILHCTCTGFGGSALEPGVPDPIIQLSNLRHLIRKGFPAERVVLRIDPIFPSDKGIAKAKMVIDQMLSMQLGIRRIRISIVDEYPHVRERYAQRGWHNLYGGNFAPSREQIQRVAQLIASYKDYDLQFETCAEPALASMAGIKATGCISNADLQLMHLPPVQNASINPQNRNGCLCLSCKTELLTRQKCPNGCVYCFWKG